VVPIVPAAILFDLSPLGRPDARPTPQMAYDATDHATSTGVAEGSVGAGTGATVGKILGPAGAMKGGFGCAMTQTPDGRITIAAMAAVNAIGDVLDARGDVLAGARRDGGFAGAMSVLQQGRGPASRVAAETALQNTTLAVVAVSCPLSAPELTQLARAATAALYRRIAPCGSSVDGDIVFAVSPYDGERITAEPMIIEALAVSALERAIERAVKLARGRDGIPGLADDTKDNGNDRNDGN
jgi:L-aminopeptidase/D-esterase-like protein